MKKTLRLNLAFIVACMIVFYGSIVAQGLAGSAHVQSSGEVVAAAYRGDFYCTASVAEKGHIAIEGNAAYGASQRVVFEMKDKEGVRAVAIVGYKVQVSWSKQGRELSVVVVEDRAARHSS